MSPRRKQSRELHKIGTLFSSHHFPYSREEEDQDLEHRESCIEWQDVLK